MVVLADLAAGTSGVGFAIACCAFAIDTKLVLGAVLIDCTGNAAVSATDLVVLTVTWLAALSSGAEVIEA